MHLELILYFVKVNADYSEKEKWKTLKKKEFLDLNKYIVYGEFSDSMYSIVILFCMNSVSKKFLVLIVVHTHKPNCKLPKEMLIL